MLEEIYLEKLKMNQIGKLATFVVQENFKHHSKLDLIANHKKAIRLIHKEEVDYYRNSEIFVFKNKLGDILGSIRVLKWNYSDLLPIQKVFKVNPLLFAGNHSFNNIWHIGRFAIKKELKSITLFKKLMVCAISPVCQHEGSMVFAECDRKLLRVLSLLGIRTRVVGKSIGYLGSETVPICMSYNGLIDFYKENSGLMPWNALVDLSFSGAPVKSVIGGQAVNYHLV